MADVVIGRNGEVVIPVVLLRQLGIEKGDRLRLDVDDERLTLTRVADDPPDRLRAAARGLFDGVEPVEYQRGLRDEWER